MTVRERTQCARNHKHGGMTQEPAHPRLGGDGDSDLIVLINTMSNPIVHHPTSDTIPKLTMEYTQTPH